MTDKLGSLRRFEWLFFERTHHGVHVYFQHSCRISNTTTIQGHINDLLFDTGLMDSMRIIELKAALTGFTLIALMAVGAKAFASDGILIATVAARNSDSYHAGRTKSL
jgi:hypothetical protein